MRYAAQLDAGADARYARAAQRQRRSPDKCQFDGGLAGPGKGEVPQGAARSSVGELLGEMIGIRSKLGVLAILSILAWSCRSTPAPTTAGRVPQQGMRGWTVIPEGATSANEDGLLRIDPSQGAVTLERRIHVRPDAEILRIAFSIMRLDQGTSWRPSAHFELAVPSDAPSEDDVDFLGSIMLSKGAGSWRTSELVYNLRNLYRYEPQSRWQPPVLLFRLRFTTAAVLADLRIEQLATFTLDPMFEE